MEKRLEYDKVIKLFSNKKEPCLSGLRYLFAKEVRDLNPSAGSNPAGSAWNLATSWKKNFA